MDTGIATEENPAYLRNNGFDCVCVSRGGLLDYSLAGTDIKTVFENRDHPVELSFAASGNRDDCDLYLYVKSEMKQQKEESINSKLAGRFVAELENIKSSLSREREIKEEGKVNQRTGRLKQKYPAIGKLYKIALKTDENKTVVDIIYEQSKPAAQFPINESGIM